MSLLERTPTSPLSGDICMTPTAPAAAAAPPHRDRPRPPALPPVVSFYKKVGRWRARARARTSRDDDAVATAQERMDMRDHDY